jgi:hypothetical protein
LPGHRLSWADHEHLLAKLANLATDAAAASRNNDDDQGAITALELGRAVLLPVLIGSPSSFRKCASAVSVSCSSFSRKLDHDVRLKARGWPTWGGIWVRRAFRSVRRVPAIETGDR